MRKTRKYLTLSLFLCCSLLVANTGTVHAEEPSGEQTAAESGLTDENTQRLEEITAMTSDGKIYEVDSTGGEVETSFFSLFARISSPKIVNFRTKGYNTTDYTDINGAEGYTCGAYGADAAYLGTENGKVKFMLSGVIGYVNASEVQVLNLSDAQSYSCYKVSNGKLIHYVTQDMTTPGHATFLTQGNAPSYLSEDTTYYSYDGNYFYTDYGTMLSDYQNNVRSQSVNASSPFYNYYQYLSLRSHTAYSAEELDSMINAKTSSSSKLRGLGSSFVNNQNTYNVNAIMMLSIAVNESGWGMSSICQSKNNLFGLNAVDTSPGTSASTYASPDECVRQFAEIWMSRWYLNPSNWAYEGECLGNKGTGINLHYASDPYWGERAANIAYNLDAIGGGKDTSGTVVTPEPEPTEPETPTPTEPEVPEEPIVTVTGVSLSKTKVTLTQGDNMTFGVSVTGENNPAQTVTWSVDGVISEGTSIDTNGKLTIAEDETAETLTVKAISTVDTSKEASATVTVTKKVVEVPVDPDVPEVTEPETPEITEPETPDPAEPSKVESVADETTGIAINGDFTSEDTVTVSSVDTETELYTTYVDPVRTQTILGVYDISLSKELSEGKKVILSFPVDSQYNDQNVVILHYVTDENDNLYHEKYTSVVTDGKAEIEVSGFSPYVLALDDAKEESDVENIPVIDPSTDENQSDDTNINDPVIQIPVADTEQTGATGDATTDTTVADETDQKQDTLQTEDTNQTDENLVVKVSGTDGNLANQQNKVEVDNKLTAQKIAANGTAAKTGDNFSVVVWLMILLVSAGVIARVYVLRKKKY